MLPFVYYSIMFFSSTPWHNRRSIILWPALNDILWLICRKTKQKKSNFLIFSTSVGITYRPTSFLFLIVFSTASSLSSVKCPCLMPSWSLKVSSVALFVILDGFLCWFLKCSFHFGSFSWLVAFSFDLQMLFFLLTLFTVSYANCDCISST